jgi:hypothetical protein
MNRSDPRLKNVCWHGQTTYYGVSCGITGRLCTGHCEQIRIKKKPARMAFYKHIVEWLDILGQDEQFPVYEICPVLKEVLDDKRED